MFTAIDQDSLVNPIQSFIDASQLSISYFHKSGIPSHFAIHLNPTPDANGKFSVSGSINGNKSERCPFKFPANTPIGAIIMVAAGVQYLDDCLIVAHAEEKSIQYRKVENLIDAVRMYFKLP